MTFPHKAGLGRGTKNNPKTITGSVKDNTYTAHQVIVDKY